jgi:hypothetical protein
MMTYHLFHPGDDENTPAEAYIPRMRRHRDRLLAESDWTQLSDAPVDRAAWADYRQALRDFPSSWTPAPTVTFPERP